MRVFIIFRRSFRSLNLCAFRIRNRNRQFPLVRAIRRFRKNRIKSIKIGAKIQNISRYDLVFYSYAFFFFLLTMNSLIETKLISQRCSIKSEYY